MTYWIWSSSGPTLCVVCVTDFNAPTVEQVEYLPVVYPSAWEVENPALFAERVGFFDFPLNCRKLAFYSRVGHGYGATILILQRQYCRLGMKWLGLSACQ